MSNLSYFKTAGFLFCLLTFLFVMPDSVRPVQTVESKKMSKQQRIDKAFELEYYKTRDPRTGTIPKERLVRAKEYTQRLLAEKDAIPGIVWEERGPDNVGGRTRAIVYDSSDPSHNTVWAAGVAGGLWKTTNFSADVPTWNNIDDFFDNLAITSILQDPTNNKIMYFGTGEGWFNVGAVRGLGIWKSTDGGNNWIQLPATNNSDFHYIQDIIIDKYGNLYATTRGAGVKRSTDGGNTWSTVLGSGSRFTDLELGTDGDIYVTEGVFSTGRVWKSDDATHGTNLGNSGTWTNITPAGSFQRIELATAPTDANRVYILCQGGNSNSVTDIFRSDNASGNSGINWTSLPVPTIIDQGANAVFTRGQAWYDLIAAVDPNNKDIVYIGGIDALRSTDAGANWTQISTWALFAATGYSGAQNVHADHHMIVFEPGSSTNAIWGTDGGLYYTQDANNTTNFPSWISKNNGYNVTQYYACATSNEVGATNFLAGAQDNGTQRYTSSGMNSTTKVTGGDGGFCHIDEDNPDIQISAIQVNNFNITNNGWSSSTRKQPAKGTFTSVSDYDSKHNILYASSTGGEYGRIKEVGTNNVVDAVTLADINDQIAAMTVSPNVDHRIYIGLRFNGRVLRIDNANGASPSSSIITPTGATGYCSSIAIEEGNENHILVSYSNYGVTNIFESTNGGSTWTALDGNLPDMPVRWIIFNPNNSDQALIATEMGVWSTTDLNGSSTDWDPTSDMLANTRVDMLQVRPADNLILAATHGRGLFTTDDLAVATISFVNSTQTTNEASASVSCPAYTDINVPIQGLASALTANATIDVTVEAATTATEGQDFDVMTDPFTFTTSGGNTQNIVVRIYDDGSVESDETIVLSINVTNPGASGASNGSLTQTTITIDDNDELPTVSTELVEDIGTRSYYIGGPFEGDVEDERYQYIILASELEAAGLSAGNIKELALEVGIKNSTIPFSNFTIRLGATTQSSLSNFINTPVTEVYSNNYSTTSGWNNFVFSTPYRWDGESNLLVEMCFDNNSTSDADVMIGYHGSSGGTPTAYRKGNGIIGCDMPIAFQRDIAKPTTRLKIESFVFPESDLNESAEQSVGPNETVYFYSSTDGELIAKIENLSSHDYGCTTVSIDRAGSGSVAQLGNEVTGKTVLITPANNNPSGSYNLTLYYTEAEISGFEAASNNGLTRNDLEMLKSSGAISSAASFEKAIVNSSTITSGDLAYTATFNTGFSGFALGAGGGPTLLITPPLPVCAPSTIDLTDPAITAGSDAGTLAYFNDEALSNPVGDPAMVGAGTYYIRLTDGSNKVSSSPVTVVVHPLPNLVVTDPATVCAPGTIDLTEAAVTAGSDAGTFTYFTDAGLTNPVTDEMAVDISGTYYIKLTDDVTGCFSSAEVNAVVNPQPSLIINNPAAVCAPNTIDLNDSAITSGSDPGHFTYFTDAGLMAPVSNSTAVGTGIYYIKLTDANGCTNSGAVSVVVHDAPEIATVGIQSNVCPATSVELTNLTITDNNSVASTTTTFHSAAPSSATDMSNQLSSTEITSDQTVYVMIANTTTGCFDVASFEVDILSCGSECGGVTDNIVLDFDGNDFVDIPSANNLPQGSAARTMECWIKTTQTSLAMIIGWGQSSTGQHNLLAIWNGQLRFLGNNYDFRGSTTINDDIWHHVAITYDGIEWKMFVDGVEEIKVATGGNPFNTPPNTTGNNLQLGKNNGGSTQYYNGLLDEVRIWDIARTGSEISNNKDIELTGNESGLLAYYDFNQGTPDGDNTGETALIDRTPNGNDGTFFNFALNGGATSNFTAPGPFQSDTQTTLSNNSPVCLGETITFTASSGATNYEFFADADMDDEVDSGESLQNGASNTYLSSTLSDGETIKVLATYSGGCTEVVASIVSIYDLSFASNVLSFDGTDDFIDASATATGLPQGASARTMEAWVKTTQTSLGNIISWGTRVTGQRNSIAVRNNKLAYVGQAFDFQGNTDINDDVWHHVAITHDGNGNWKFYVDGVLDADLSPGTPNTVGDNLRIGQISVPSTGEFYNGLLDEVRIWDYERSQSEIQASKDSELTGNESGLLVYYNFNQGIPDGDNTAITNVADQTSNAFDGALTNFGLTSTTSNFTAPSPIGSAGSGTLTLTNDSPTCLGETITFTATSGLTNYEFFADLNMNSEVDGGESLQSGTSNIYTTTSLDDGTIISVIGTDDNGCTTVATSTASVSSFGAGGNNNALDFGGSDDYVSLGDLGAVSDWTIETWMKPDGEFNYQNIFHTEDLGGNKGIRLESSANFSAGHLYVNIADNAGAGAVLYTIIPSSGSLLNQWYHVAIVGDQTNNKVRIYLDGVEVVNQSHTAWATSFPDFVIGRGAASITNRNYNGVLDEFRIWNIAKSEVQVLAEKDIELTGSEAGLLAYYNFNQGTAGGDNISETILSDSSPNGNDGTLTSFTLTGTESNWISSDVGINALVSGRNAMDFGESDDYVSVGNLGSVTDWTIETWIKPDGEFNYQNIFHTDDLAANVGIRLETSANYVLGHLYVSIRNEANQGNAYTIIPLSGSLLNQWYHLALVGDQTNNTVRIYLDGVEVVNQTHTGWATSFPDFVIGRGFSAGNERNYNGVLDEFRIWNIAKSEAQVLAQKDIELSGSEAGLLAYYDFNQGVAGGNNSNITTVLDGSPNNNDGTPVNLSLSGSESNFITSDAPISGAGTIMLSNDSPVCAGETITFTATGGASNYEFFDDINMNGQVDGGESLQSGTSHTYTTSTLSDGDTISLLVTNANGCTTVLTSVVSVSSFGTASNVLDFDGVDDKVEFTDFNFYQNSFTVEGWFNSTDASAGASIFHVYDAANNGTAISVQLLSGGRLQAIIRNPPASSEGIGMLSTSIVGDGNWHHFALVKGDDDRFKFYIDGVAEATPGNIVADFTGTYSVVLGFNAPTSPRYYDGQMDEIRLWNVERSEAEILANKDMELTGSEAGLVAYYNFNQGTPDADNTAITTLFDQTVNNHDGTLTNFALNSTSSNWRGASPINTNSISLTNNGPICAGETITFTASIGAANYEFFADANMDGEVDPGESLQSSVSNMYATSDLGDGDIISVLATSASGCTALVTSTASVSEFVLQATDNALNFDGSNDFVNVPTATGLPQGNSARTMEAWVKTTQTSIGNIISWGTRSTRQRNALAVRDGKLAFIGQYYDFKGKITINDGQWHHLAITYDGTNWKLFVDGVEDEKVRQFGNPFNDPLNTIGNDLRIGLISQPSVAEYYKGTVDEVRIWNYARSSAQINASKNVELTGTETGLLVYYQFNQGTADADNTGETTLTDITANSFNGTLTNFALNGTTSNWTTSRSLLAVGNVALSSNGPVCPGEPITFSATEGAMNYEFFEDIDMDGEVDGGESLQSGTSNIYTTAAFSDGDVVSVLATDLNGCTTIATSTATSSDFALQTGGNALDFDGGNDFVNAGNILTASYTKEVWVNIDLNNGKNNNIISGGGNTGRHAFWAPVGYGYRVSAGHNNVWNLVQDPSPIQGGWQHYAVTYDATSKEMKLYKNGTLVSQRANVIAYTNGNQVLLGSYQNGNLFGGKMDEVRIWNYARTQVEIQAQKDVALTGGEAGLLAYYDFNQGIPEGDNVGEAVLLDRSQNGNNANLINFGLTGGDNSNWVLSKAPMEVTTLQISNNSPVCPGDDVTFMVTAGAINYEFFLDADGDGVIDGGESLQNGTSNSYTTNTLDGGDVISVLVTDTKGCTDVLASVVTFNIDGCESTGFVVTFRTTAPNENITIPTFSGENYNYSVSWGDGESNLGIIGDAEHTYELPGLYTVSIIDTFPRIYFNGTGESREKIQAIKQWGDIPWSSLEGAFDGCTNLVYDAVDTLNMAGVTSTARAFRNCKAFNGNINGWDVSAVLNMESMFEGATAFNQPLDTWDVSRVLSMRNMFSGATAFDQSLGSWDITGLNANTAMLNMLTNCGMLTETYDATLIGWEAQAVPDNMTLGAQSLKYCGARNERTRLKNEHNWVFVGDEIDGDVCGDLPFVTTWRTSTSQPTVTIYTNSAFTYDYAIDWGDGTIDENVTGNKSHTYSDHSQPQTVSISGEFPSLFWGNRANKEQMLSLEQWGSISWESLKWAFVYAKNMVYRATDVPDLTQATNMQASFYGADSFNGDLNEWDVSKVSSFWGTFAYTKSFNSDLSRWDVSNATRTAEMFRQAVAFDQDIGSWSLQSLVPNSYYSANTMLDNTALSIENYDNTLLGWADQAASLPNNITVGARNLRYCAGEAARNTLINTKGWTFVGDGKDCGSSIVAPPAEESAIAVQEESIELSSTHADMVVYPNPAGVGGEVLIAINAIGSETHTLRIFDQLGRLVVQQEIEEDWTIIPITLDAKRFQTGLYTVSLLLDDQLLTRQLIIVE